MPKVQRLAAALAVVVLSVTAMPARSAPQPIAPVEWTRSVLTTAVSDPTDLDVAPDGTVVIVERLGAVKVWHQDGTLRTAGTIKVSANASLTETAQDELEEGGIHGVLLDRAFLQTRKVFVRYSVPGSVGKNGDGVFRVSSFTLSRDDKLDLRSERKILDTPAEWGHCCHYGGDMEWRKDGTILLSVGDDTSPRDEGWNPRDKRKGREAFDADRTSQNKLDLRGKVLRFNPDGSVPRDNPHVKDKAYNPYVYAMGFRSDYRIGYDPKTDTTYVGNVGPDAQTADASRGPAGHDELEVITSGGGSNHGWPRCIANNLPYQDYDYATSTSKGPLSCAGMTPATLYYPYVPSSTFPAVAAGTRTSMAGPVYRYSGKGALQLPVAFHGKLLHWDWSRSLMFATPVRADGTLDVGSLTPWSAAGPNTFFSAGAAVPLGGPAAPMEMAVGPDGALYVAEYGSGYYSNTNSAISRITCFQCTPKAADYVGSTGTPVAGSTPDEAGCACGPTAVAGGIPNPPPPAAGGLAATGGPVGALGALGACALLIAVVLRRRRHATLDPSGI